MKLLTLNCNELFIYLKGLLRDDEMKISLIPALFLFGSSGREQMAMWHQGRQGSRTSNLSTRASRHSGAGHKYSHHVQKEHGFNVPIISISVDYEA